jgi:hypothetical protein
VRRTVQRCHRCDEISGLATEAQRGRGPRFSKGDLVALF